MYWFFLTYGCLIPLRYHQSQVLKIKTSTSFHCSPFLRESSFRTRPMYSASSMSTKYREWNSITETPYSCKNSHIKVWDNYMVYPKETGPFLPMQANQTLSLRMQSSRVLMKLGVIFFYVYFIYLFIFLFTSIYIVKF